MFKKENLTGDIFGGVTAAIVALPLALAFGVQSGLGAIAGLYGAIALGILAALFGGTKTQISGPTGPMVVVSAAIVAGEIALYGSIENALGTIVATFVLAGIFQILMGFSKIGEYIRYMPYPVVSGFMSGIGVIIILMQVFPFFGLPSPKDIVSIVMSFNKISPVINYEAMLVSITTIAIIYLFPKLTKKIPSTLVALIILTLIVAIFKLNVPLIGDIPSGIPEIHIDSILNLDWYHPMNIIVPALTLAALGAIDSLLTSVVADNMTKTQHNSNRELIGQGIGNSVAGLIGGLPGAGATMRTVVNINAGGKTQLSGVIHGIVLLIVLFGAGVYAKLIPLPVLAGILITVGIGIIDYKGIKHITHVPKVDAGIMVIVLTLTVFVDLLQAVAVGMVLASILFMKKMGDLSHSSAKSSSLAELTEEWEDEKNLSKEIKEQTYMQHFTGPIFFGFASNFREIMRELPNVKVVILRMKDVPYIDQSGLYAIEEAVLELEQKGIRVIITGMQPQIEDMLKNVKLIPDVIPANHTFPVFQDAINTLEEHHLNIDEI